MKKIVLKVSIICNKCKICIMVIIAKFDGITSIALDEEKSTVTIVGDVDAVLVVKALRKAKKAVEIVSIGEPDKKEEGGEKKDEPSETLPACCSACKPALIYYEDPNVCTIL